MYLAGSFILLLSTMTIVGTLLSDILLAIVDPAYSPELGTPKQTSVELSQQSASNP